MMKKTLSRVLLVTLVLAAVLVGGAVVWAASNGVLTPLLAGVNAQAAQGNLPLDTIQLPPGFQIALYAENVRGARSMVLGDDGTLFVGSRDPSNVYAIPNAATTERAERVLTVARGLNNPNGVAFRDGALVVAEINRILRYDNIEASLDAPPQPVVVRADLPTEPHHGWRYTGFAPDGSYVIAFGAPCNVCELTGVFGTIARLPADLTGDFEIIATGIRNSVGFDWDPATGDLWFTNNGRDWMGDDLPPDTLHHLATPGDYHGGFPYCHAGTIPDPDFGSRRPCSDFDAPAQTLTPHGAALGMAFYDGDMFPEDYVGDIFVAERGSWNRTVPIGYRVMQVTRDADGNATGTLPFAQGWLRANGQAWGRPVDVLVMPDGALLVSDDTANAIYRISVR